MEYCEKEQNYSYVELIDYARKNKSDWIITLKNKNARMVISEYLKSERRKQKKEGIQQPTLKESLDKIYK